MNNIKFEPMIKYFPNEVNGKQFSIKHVTLDEVTVKLEKLRDIMNGRSLETRGLKPGTYVKLVNNETELIMMSDTWMEEYTNHWVYKANGNVLLAGLGMGFCLKPLYDNPKVRSITIIEKEKEIIDLIIPRLTFINGQNKIQTINADVFNWKPDKYIKYDVIFFDIWPTIDSKNYSEMKILHAKFKNKLNRENPNAFMDSWRKYDCKRML